MSRARGLTLGSLALLALGLWLARRVEPGVRVESLDPAGHVPALRFTPRAAGPHPVALLAHGVSASKETLFRFGEALAAAGFTAYAVDLPGHGASPERFGGAIVGALERAAHAVGPVDVFVGHSMGAYVGSAVVRGGAITPRLFVAVGARPDFGRGGPPVLLLMGQLEEAVPRDRRAARDGERLVVSPWSDHALEPYDPRLVGAAVEAAAQACELAPPAPPTAWRWRLAGLLLGLAGALALAARLGALVPRARGAIVALTVIAALALLARPWVGSVPTLRRLPVAAALAALAWLALRGAAALRVPRWAAPAAAALLALGAALAGVPFGALIAGLFALACLAAEGLARLAERGAARPDGDLAYAIVIGYALGQWLPLFY